MAASNTTWGRALDEAKEALLRNKVSTSLSRLQSAATELATELEDKHRLDGDAQEIKVVHYTSLETAHALLTEPATQYLRLYDSVHLTDPQEGWYVFSGHDFFRSSRVRLLHGWPPSAETVNRIDPPSAACRRGARCPAELEGAGDLRPDHRVELAVGELVGVFADALATVVVRVVNVPNQFTAACSRPSAPWLSATSYTW